MSKGKQGRPKSEENYIKKQISFPEEMYVILEDISKKSGINNLNAIVRNACSEFIDRELRK